MNKIYCPIVMYTSFTSSKEHAKDFNVHIAKFENDIKEILSSGHTPISLRQLSDAMHFNAQLPQNPICIILFGGYKNQYDYAYPILSKYRIKADLFIATELVGLTSYPGISKFEPHFGWDDANVMHASNLIDIYALWHVFDNGKEYEKEISRKIELITSKIPDNDPRTAFFMEMSQDITTKQQALESVHIGLNIVSYYSAFANRVDKGYVPYIEIKQELSIMDAIDAFAAKYNFMFKLDANLDHIDKVENNCTPPHHNIALPIDKDPPIKNLLRNAIPLSVISAFRAEKSALIVLNNFIEVIFHPWYHYFDYDNHQYIYWPELTCCRLEKDIIRNMNINEADLVTNGLESGYYVDAWIDEYYVPGKNNYKRLHSAHNVLIYGYDIERNTFKTLTYTKSGYYEDLEISSIDFLKSCASEYFVCLQFLKNNPNYQLTYDIRLIKSKLKSYIDSKYEYANNTKYSKYDCNQLCNYSACVKFVDYIKSTAETDGKIYLVCFYGYLEHKRCMGWRLHYLAEKEGYNKSCYLTYQEYCQKTTDHLVNLALKYNASKNKRTLNRIINLIEELNKNELNMIEGFLSE